MVNDIVFKILYYKVIGSSKRRSASKRELDLHCRHQPKSLSRNEVVDPSLCWTERCECVREFRRKKKVRIRKAAPPSKTSARPVKTTPRRRWRPTRAMRRTAAGPSTCSYRRLNISTVLTIPSGIWRTTVDSPNRRYSSSGRWRRNWVRKTFA